MEITTPLGADVLLFHAMHAREELSRVGECRLDLLSLKNDVNLDDILGQNVTVKVALPDEGVRYFNGFVTRFSQGATYGKYRRYYATVSTWAWFLSRTADCRIFQEMTVPEIVAKIFSEHPTAMFKDDTTGKYRKWNYCVQYRETDLNFVSRLMEHEGIYFYFKHAEGKHEMIMADSYSGHAPCQAKAIPFIAPEDLARPDIEHISAWTLTREIQPGVYVQDDYDFERPSVELRTQKAVVRQYSPSTYEVYDYPGYYAQRFDGETTAAVRIEEYAAQFETAQATTNAKSVAVGSLFDVEKCPRSDQDGEHLVVAATYELEYSDYEAMPDRGGAEYRCSFVAMPSKQQYRPRRLTPKPFVQGPQTAVVVGPAGDEIYTDKYGRVKVLFHWDREGEKKKDENCSCWIRVSHPWAGKGWGSVATPRIGQEVIVDFLEGDPDQPIITGRVYNAENQPPFGFPAGAVLSGYKSQTHKGAGFNELSMDDSAGKERVFIHGQYNMDTVVEHDQTSTIHNNRTDRVDVDDAESIGNNQKWDVAVNRDAKIGSNETLDVGANRTVTVGANQSTTIGANETKSITGNRSLTTSGSETATVTMQRTHSVGINETISVGAAQEITVGGLQAITVGAAQTVNVGASQSTTVGAGQSLKVGAAQSVDVGAAANLKVGADQAIKVAGGRSSDIGKDDAIKAGKNFVVDAGDSVTIKTGSASITMKKDGTITIKGKDITIQGSGKVNVKASSNIVMKGSKILEN
jgi:type VI secretion system secreted protein VgrG